jgi:hypothetical protein
MLQSARKVHPKLSKDRSESFDLCQINHYTSAVYEIVAIARRLMVRDNACMAA